MNTDDLLEQEIRLQQEKAEKAIKGKSPGELITYAQKRLESATSITSDNLLRWTFIGYIKSEEPPAEIIRLAEESGHAYEALKNSVRQLRRKNYPLPLCLLEFMLDTELGVKPKAKKKKRPKKHFRDLEIVRCIQDIEKFSSFKPTRNAENPGQVCGASILADASGISYETIKDIWEKRDRKLVGENRFS